MEDSAIIGEFGSPDRFRSVAEAKAAIDRLRELFNGGSGVAGFCLAILLCPGLVGGTLEVRAYLSQFGDECEALYRKSFPLLTQNAETGSTEAMNCLAIYYQTGLPPVERSLDTMRMWDERAARSSKPA